MLFITVLAVLCLQRFADCQELRNKGFWKQEHGSAFLSRLSVIVYLHLCPLVSFAATPGFRMLWDDFGAGP